MDKQITILICPHVVDQTKYDRQTQLDHLNLVLSFSHRAIQTRRQTDTTRSLKSCTVVLDLSDLVVSVCRRFWIAR
jgi:hypothetical protein